MKDVMGNLVLATWLIRSNKAAVRRHEVNVNYRIPFNEQAPQTYPLLGTML